MKAEAKVPAVTRAVGVLRVLAAHPAPVPAASVARELGLPRSTVYQLLAALEAAGLVTHLPEERTYGLGVGVFELGSAYLRNDPLGATLPSLARDRRRQDPGDGPPRRAARRRDALPAQGAATAPGDPGHRRGRTAAGPADRRRTVDARAPAGRPGARPLPVGGELRRPHRRRPGLAPSRSCAPCSRSSGVAAGPRRTVTSPTASRRWPPPAFDHLGRPVAAIGVTFPSHQHPPGERTEVAAVVRQAAGRLTRRLSGPRARRPRRWSADRSAYGVPPRTCVVSAGLRRARVPGSTADLVRVPTPPSARRCACPASRCPTTRSLATFRRIVSGEPEGRPAWVAALEDG